MHTLRIARILQCFGGGLRCASCGGIQGVCHTPAIIVKTKTMAFFITRRKTTSDVGKTMSDVENIMSDVIQTTSDLFSTTCNALKNIKLRFCAKLSQTSVIQFVMFFCPHTTGNGGNAIWLAASVKLSKSNSLFRK